MSRQAWMAEREEAWRGIRRRAGTAAIAVVCACLLAAPGSLDAQAVARPTPDPAATAHADRARAAAARRQPPPPEAYADLLSLPPVLRPFVGAYVGGGGGTGVGGLVGAGIYRGLLNPATGLLGLQLEGAIGTETNRAGPRGALMAGVRSPILRLGMGIEVDLPDGQASPYFSLMHPLVRGGFLLPGTMLHATWTPAGAERLRIGFVLPVGQRLRGEDRPKGDRVHLAEATPPVPPAPPAADPLRAAAADLRAWALRVGAVVVPYLRRAGGGTPPAEVVDSLAALGRLVAASGGAGAVLAAYHHAFDRAFSVALDPRAAGVTPRGRARADSMRLLLLARVLLPYDRLLGQKREPVSLAPFAAALLEPFAGRRVVRAEAGESGPASGGGLVAGTDDLARTGWLLARLLDAVGEVAAEQQRRWGDWRLVWLPLQLALREEDHCTQEQVDRLIERATGAAFSDSNHVAYARNSQFQWELDRSIHEARTYHVLWIHDFHGVDQHGVADSVAFRMVAYGYLDALIRRVRAYDATGVLPQFHIFLDQYYFEAHRSRLWMPVLTDPLSRGSRLRGAPRAWAAVIDSLQGELRRAVAASRRLQTEARGHGADWLHDRVAVHVHVTDQQDPSFWSPDILPLVGLPDNALRDHRKLAFYDLTEGDPYRGMLIMSGMGVGEDYAGPEWEDRAVLLQGPAALPVKEAASRLLLRQGVKPDQLPSFLRPPGDAAAVADPAPVPRFDLTPATVVQLHNRVGYGFKAATIAKAMLYSLLPPGSVLRIPDSLWSNPLWASLLVGRALDGGRVLVMAPSVRNAPAPYGGAMALAEATLSHLLFARRTLAPAIHGAGGLLRVGIYDTAIPVVDLPARIDTALARRARTPWLLALEPFSTAVVDSLHAVAERLRARGFEPPRPADPGEHPKLHMKAQFFASAEGWDNLFADPAWGHLLAAYFRGRARIIENRLQYLGFFPLEQAADSRAAGGGLFQTQVTRDKPDRVIYYLLQGSHNEDYRSALLDGEAVLLISHFGAAIGIGDFALLPDLCVWVETPEELHRYIPRPGRLGRGMARRLRIMY